ncbi:hypothetical protein, partial [Cellulomonas rhizosphaerae]
STTSKPATLWVDSVRTDPFAPGSVLSLTSYGAMIGATDVNATNRVLAENRYNDVPPPGWTYVLAPVAVCYMAESGSGTPWLDLDVEFIGSDGRTYDDGYNVTPSDIYDLGDLYAPNGCGSFYAAALVPRSVLTGAVWVITDTSSWSSTTKQFVKVS